MWGAAELNIRDYPRNPRNPRFSFLEPIPAFKLI